VVDGTTHRWRLRRRPAAAFAESVCHISRTVLPEA
jgi:hypothetical protein